jgi:hypothetical protein
MKNKDKVIKYGLFILLGLGLIAYIPQVWEWIIDLIEYIIQENVSDRQMSYLSKWPKFYICIILFTGLILKEKNGIKTCLNNINFKVFLKPVLLMTGIYLLGIISILSADFLYIDDVQRAAGIKALTSFSWDRYLSDILSKLVHTTPMIADLSPLTQILAIIILSVSSVLFVYVLCDRKIKTIALLASIPLGLSPYILENLSYKFDAPYMMLSILFSIIPFLFVESRRYFVVISIISLMLMCLTYQASSGIYLLIALYLCYHQWNHNKKTLKQTGVFFLTSVASYVCTLIAYRLLFVTEHTNMIYAGTEAFDPSQLIPGIIQNISRYFTYIHSDFATLWQILIVSILICFIVQSVRNSQRNKWVAVISSCFIILITAILSYGPYLILKSPLFLPRGLYGFGFFIAMFCIGSISGGNKFSIVCALALSYCFLVFATIYGNALADQKRYVNFRMEILANDLGRLFPNGSQKVMKVQIENKIEHGAAVESIAEYYPVIKRLVPYRHQGEFDYVICSQLFNYHNLWKYEETDNEFSKDNLPVLYDCYYHTIYGQDECVLIIFKNNKDEE